MDLNRTDDITPTTVGISLVYRDSYTISQLSTTDEGRVVHCQGIIETTPSQSITETLTLDVTGQYI